MATFTANELSYVDYQRQVFGYDEFGGLNPDPWGGAGSNNPAALYNVPSFEAWLQTQAGTAALAAAQASVAAGTNQTVGGGFFSSLADIFNGAVTAIIQALPGTLVVASAGLAGGALAAAPEITAAADVVSEGAGLYADQVASAAFADAGPLGASADTLAASTVGDASLPVGDSPLIASDASNTAMVGEEVATAEAAAAGTIPAESSAATLTGYTGFMPAGLVINAPWLPPASDASNSAMVGEDVTTAAAADAGTIPAASSTPDLTGFTGFTPIVPPGFGLTIGDAATLARAAASVARTAAAGRVLSSPPSAAASPFGVFYPVGGTAPADQPAPAPNTGLTALIAGNPLVAVVLVSGGALLVLKFLAKKG